MQKPFPVHAPQDVISRRALLKGAGAAAIGISFAKGGPAWSQEEEKLVSFYNWDTYIGETTLADFAAATGITVKMDLFGDNDELFTKLKAGNPGYDVIVPTNNMVERMIKAGMLEPLDHVKIPNIANIDPVFMGKEFDPGRKYSLPYTWGTLGIGYRKSKVPTGFDSWKLIYASDQLAGRIAVMGDPEHLLGPALKYLGYSFNSTDPAELKKVEELILAQKKNIKIFAKDNGQDLLASGEVDAVVEWSGDIVQVMKDDPDIAYSVPKEGSVVWEDTLAIPKGAPHPQNAHIFINYLLDAKVGAAITDTIRFPTPNAAAKALMPDDYKNNPAIFPSAEVLAKCEPPKYLGEEATRLRDEIYTRIAAA